MYFRIFEIKHARLLLIITFFYQCIVKKEKVIEDLEIQLLQLLQVMKPKIKFLAVVLHVLTAKIKNKL